MQHSQKFLAIVEDAKSRIREVTIEQVRADSDSGAEFVLVDTREDREWKRARAVGAVHLSKGVIERDVEATIADVSAKIVLYCGGGFRSALAADALQKMGYQDVYSLAGGWRAWNDAGMPVERDDVQDGE